MANGLNRFNGIGNLGADPELRYTQNGTPVMNMRIACNERVKDKDGNYQDRTEWVNAVLWGKRAEGLAPHLSKGSTVFFEGPLRTSSYDDRDGNKRYKTEIVIQNIILCGGKKAGGAAQGASQSGSQRSGSGRKPQHTESAAEDYGGSDYADDDIPF